MQFSNIADLGLALGKKGVVIGDWHEGLLAKLFDELKNGEAVLDLSGSPIIHTLHHIAITSVRYEDLHCIRELKSPRDNSANTPFYFAECMLANHSPSIIELAIRKLLSKLLSIESLTDNDFNVIGSHRRGPLKVEEGHYPGVDSWFSFEHYSVTINGKAFQEQGYGDLFWKVTIEISQQSAV